MLQLALDDPRWVDFVFAAEGATPFHHPAWATLLADCYRYPAFALALEDSQGNVVAGVPTIDVSNRLSGKRWVSLPYTDECPPLVAPRGSIDELTTSLEAERERREISEFEFRGGLPGQQVRLEDQAVVHTLQLRTGVEQLERGFRRNVRQHIAKGQRSGVTVRRAETAGELAGTFYGLHVRTRRRLGVPVQPRRYFVRLWERMLEPGLGFCLIAYVDRTPIAGAVFLVWKRTVLFKYSASDERFRGLRPNYVLLSEAIRWSCANGYSVFDFGRTDRDNDGLRQFKSSWGAQEEPLIYSFLGGTARRSASSGSGASLLKPLIRNSPPVVCRALGELLYRYAA